MKVLDISSNRFMGPFPVSLLALPSLSYLDISDNRLTGMLQEGLQCNDELEFVNVTSNMLTGKLPQCLLSDSRKRIFRYAKNCLEVDDGDEHQHPVSSYRNEALAVGILPCPTKRSWKTGLIVSVLAGVIGGIVVAVAAYLIAKKLIANKEAKRPAASSVGQKESKGYTPKLLQDATSSSAADKLPTTGQEDVISSGNNWGNRNSVQGGSRTSEKATYCF